MKRLAIATTLLAATALAGCGTAGVTLSTTGGSADDLLKAAENKAVVVSVPISKIVIKVSADNQDSGSEAPGDSADTDIANLLARRGGQGQQKDHAQGAHHGHSSEGSPHSPRPAHDSRSSSSEGNAQTSPIVTQTIVIGGVTYSISTIPEEDPTTTFRATPINNFFSTNNLGVSKVANGDIPTSVTNDFTDQTQSRITAVGSIVASVAGAFAKGGLGVGLFGRQEGQIAQTAGPACPTKLASATIDGTVQNVTANWSKLENSSCWSFAFEVTGRQVDTVRRSDFEDIAAQGKNLKAWPVPACLDVKLLFKQSAPAGPATDTDADIVVPLKIADPATLRLVGIPDKGKIAMHPICDADVTDNPVDRWSTSFDSIAALETQAKAIAGAKQKSKP